MPSLCFRPRRVPSRLLARRFLCLLLPFRPRSPPPPPLASIRAACTACKFPSVSPRPIGVLQICGSPNGCCAAAYLPTKSALYCDSEAPAFLVVTPIPKITCAAHSLERHAKPCLFPRAVPLLAFDDAPAARPVCVTLPLTHALCPTLIRIALPMARHRRALPPLLTMDRHADENRSSIQDSRPCGACSPQPASPPARLSQPADPPVRTLSPPALALAIAPRPARPAAVPLAPSASSAPAGSAPASTDTAAPHSESYNPLPSPVV